MRVVVGIACALLCLTGCSKRARNEDFGPGTRKRIAFAADALAGPVVRGNSGDLQMSQYGLNQLLDMLRRFGQGDQMTDVVKKLPPGARLDGPFVESIAQGVGRHSYSIKGTISGRVDFVVFSEMPQDLELRQMVDEFDGTLGTGDFAWAGRADQPDRWVQTTLAELIRRWGEPTTAPDEDVFDLFDVRNLRAVETGIRCKGWHANWMGIQGINSIDCWIGRAPAVFGPDAVVFQASVEYGGWPTLRRD